MSSKVIGQSLIFSALALTGIHLSANELSSSLIAHEQKSSKPNTAAPINAWPLFNPNAVTPSNDLWINGEVLFWKSNVGSLDYGTESKSSTTIQDGHVKQPHFNWDWGFRLGLGYKLPHDKWDLLINYTYLLGRANGHENDSDKVIFPSWASGFNFDPDTQGTFYAAQAKARWNLTLNMADIELGRTCFVGKWLSIRPFIGVRGLVTNQEYHVEYKGGTVAPNDEDKIHLNTDFWGVGLRMGFNSLWGLGKGIGIYSNGSASLLSGHFDVHENEKLEKEDIHLFKVKRDTDNVVVTADLALGLQWDYMFSKNRYHLGVKFGWEFNMFFDQNQLFNFLSPTNPGSIHFSDDDLSFQGLTLGIRFDF